MALRPSINSAVGCGWGAPCIATRKAPVKETRRELARTILRECEFVPLGALLPFRRGPEAAHGSNVEAKKHQLHGEVAGLFAPLRQRILPVAGMPRQLFLGMFSFICVLRLPQFQVGPGHDYAGPVRSAPDFVGLQAKLGILPHPLNFLAEGRKKMEAAGLVGKCHRHDIRLIVQRTGQPADRYPLQHLNAFFLGYGNDSHDGLSPEHATASLNHPALFTRATHSRFWRMSGFRHNAPGLVRVLSGLAWRSNRAGKSGT